MDHSQISVSPSFDDVSDICCGEGTLQDIRLEESRTKMISQPLHQMLWDIEYSTFATSAFA